MTPEEAMFQLPRDAVEALAGPLTNEQARALEAYGALVQTAGRRTNLLSTGDLGRLDEHIVDSAALLRAVDVGDRLADIGSGAGLPGIVVAVARPGTAVTLVDARRSKAVFLKQAVRQLQLSNVRVVHERLERLPETQQYTMATSRALGDITKTLAPSLRVVEPGGRLVLFKGPGWPDERGRAVELADAEGAGIEHEIDVELPGFGRTTTFVVFHVKPREPRFT